MLPFVSTIHILLCVFMIFVILLQPGKDAGMGAAFGGGAATSAFGGRGAVTFLGKVTAVCAIAFFVTSLGLSFVGLRKSVAGSIAAPKPGATAPATPGTDAKSDTKSGDVNKADADKGAAPAALPPPSGTEAVPADKAPEEKK